MNIKCNECGHENQLGAIFCRNCGAKLDLESMRPAVADTKVKGGAGALASRLAGVVILIAVLSMLAALMLPLGLRPYEPASEDVAKEAKSKVDAMMARIDTGKGLNMFVLTPPEAMSAVNKLVFGEEPAAPASGSGYVLEHILFDVSAAGEAVIAIDAKIAGKVPVRFEIVGKPSAKEGEAGAPSTFSFAISSATMGHVPMPAGFLRDKIAEKFVAILQGRDVDKLLKALKNVEINQDGNVALSFPEAKTAKPAGAKK